MEADRAVADVEFDPQEWKDVSLKTDNELEETEYEIELPNPRPRRNRIGLHRVPHSERVAHGSSRLKQTLAEFSLQNSAVLAAVLVVAGRTLEHRRSIA